VPLPSSYHWKGGNWQPQKSKKFSSKTIQTTWLFAALNEFATVGSKMKLKFDILDDMMGYSLENEIFYKSCMHSTSLKINQSARDRKTA